jgi:hypothetical protein
VVWVVPVVDIVENATRLVIEAPASEIIAVNELLTPGITTISLRI